MLASAETLTAEMNTARRAKDAEVQLPAASTKPCIVKVSSGVNHDQATRLVAYRWRSSETIPKIVYSVASAEQFCQEALC